MTDWDAPFLQTNDITNVDDLVGQSKIKYGAVASGSTFNFFRVSYTHFVCYKPWLHHH